MRVGILTFHHVPNYGAVLQAFALAQALRSLGHEPEVVDYRPWRATYHYLSVGMRTRPVIAELRRNFRIARFVRDMLPLSARRIRRGRPVRELSESYDALIGGSDQVWCWAKEWTYRRYDPTFFLAHARPGIRRVAYAPSCGGMTSFGSRVREAAALLNRFDALSARDENTQRLVQEATGRVCELVLDPTFLHDFDEAPAARPSGAGTEPYLLVCGVFSRNDRSRLRQVASEMNLRCVSIPRRDPAADGSLVDADPIEWLSAIRNASFVVTNLFHGTAFALHFDRSFISITNGYSRTKVTDLLHRFGLTRRYASQVDPRAIVDLASRRTDLDEVRAKLVAARAQSLRFLETSLGGSSRRSRPAIPMEAALDAGRRVPRMSEGKA